MSIDTLLTEFQSLSDSDRQAFLSQLSAANQAKPATAIPGHIMAMMRGTGVEMPQGGKRISIEALTDAMTKKHYTPERRIEVKTILAGYGLID